MNYKKLFVRIMAGFVAVYLLICVVLYLGQEKLIFHPEVLAKDYKYTFEQAPEEIFITTKDGIKLNAILFKADSSKGVIFYLHGNGGALDGWGRVGGDYTKLHYDLFMLDYRGYGKSEGSINSQKQFYDDVQSAYDSVKSRYGENNIVILGYSIGTGPAAMLAAMNHPRMLILQAPYYSLPDMMHQEFPFVPDLLLKYKFQTCEFIRTIKAPIVIFHGNKDEEIYYGSSLKLKKLLKPSDILITLEGQGHNDMSNNKDYQRELARILQ